MYLLSKLSLNEERTIDWKDFLHNFCSSEVRTTAICVSRKKKKGLCLLFPHEEMQNKTCNFTGKCLLDT